MEKGRLRITDILSAIYTVFMVPWILFLIIADIMALTTIPVILTSGFANTNLSDMLCVCTMFIAPSFMIPGLRRMFYRLPWLEPFIVMVVLDSALIILAYTILNYGFQVVSPTRHAVFTILAIAWLIGGRLAQCFVLDKHPIRFVGREML